MSLVVIELKKSKTPRDVVAQAIDYATWVEGLEADEISNIFENYSKGQNLKDAFRSKFHVELEEENLNQSHQMVIVASELDEATERIIHKVIFAVPSFGIGYSAELGMPSE